MDLPSVSRDVPFQPGPAHVLLDVDERYPLKRPQARKRSALIEGATSALATATVVASGLSRGVAASTAAFTAKANSSAKAYRASRAAKPAKTAKPATVAKRAVVPPPATVKAVPVVKAIPTPAKVAEATNVPESGPFVGSAVDANRARTATPFWRVAALGLIALIVVAGTAFAMLHLLKGRSARSVPVHAPAASPPQPSPKVRDVTPSSAEAGATSEPAPVPANPRPATTDTRPAFGDLKGDLAKPAKPQPQPQAPAIPRLGFGYEGGAGAGNPRAIRSIFPTIPQGAGRPAQAPTTSATPSGAQQDPAAASITPTPRPQDTTTVQSPLASAPWDLPASNVAPKPAQASRPQTVTQRAPVQRARHRPAPAKADAPSPTLPSVLRP